MKTNFILILLLMLAFVVIPRVYAQNLEAEQLAAALNSLNNGCAEADGSTVRVTGFVGVRRSITVPAGVTLHKVTFWFLPGCNFDFEWFRFE